MRRLKLLMQITADGVVAGPESQLDWMTWNMDESERTFASCVRTRSTYSASSIENCLFLITTLILKNTAVSCSPSPMKTLIAVLGR